MRTCLAAAAVILAVSACGSAAHPAARATRSAASSAASPAVHLTARQETRECAALDMVRLGSDTYAAQVRVIAGEYGTSQDDARLIIARAVGDRCPSLVSVIPAGAPLPPRA